MKPLFFNKTDTVSIDFNAEINCEGEILIANFFTIGSGSKTTANAIPIDDESAIRGTTVDNAIQLPIDLSQLDEGCTYSLVVKTNETGVVYKNIIRINDH